MNLNEKVKISKKIIESYAWQPVNQIIWYTGGKDSTVLHYLITEQCGYKLKSAFINTGFKFPETIELVSKLENITIIPPLFNSKITKDNGREQCCHERKTTPMLEFHEKEQIKIAYYGIRWDENPARENDPYMIIKQGVKRIYPLLHWTEADIWEYIKLNNLKVNKLYEQGYRSLGCKCCTSLSKEGGNERSGRCQEKENVMSTLRTMGYM